MIQTEQRTLRVLSDIPVEKWTAEIVQEYPHLATSFTQGLEFDGNTLFEGTGDPNQSGQTLVAEVDLKSGEQKRKSALDASYFGEGISIFGDELFQLTWKNGKCFVYDKNTFSVKRELNYTGEGWGLCHDDKNLIMTDGSERIFFRDPKTFEVIKTIEVYTDQGPLNYLNELEYQEIEGYKIENLPAGNTANNYGNYQGSMSNHDKVYENVLEVLNHNASIATNSFEALKTVEIIDKIYQSKL
jgi:glutamine cyclotransferase